MIQKAQSFAVKVDGMVGEGSIDRCSDVLAIVIDSEEIGLGSSRKIHFREPVLCPAWGHEQNRNENRKC
jgi:hypothetical protein